MTSNFAPPTYDLESSMKNSQRSVWIINHYISDPRDTASGSRHHSLGRGLAAAGWQVSLIAASAAHNSRTQRVGPTEKLATSMHDGVTFRWLRTSTYRGNGIGRVINILQFTLAVLRMRSVDGLPRPDIIIGSTVHPLAAWAAKVISRRHRVPFVFEIRDLWPQTLIDMQKLHDKGVVSRVLRGVELHLCRSAEMIIVLVPFAADYLAERGIRREKVVWISNGTDVNEFKATEAPKASPFTFMYFGAHGSANGIDSIIGGFAKYQEESAIDSRLVLVGNGPQREALKGLAQRLPGREKVVFREAVPKSEIPEIASEAHALVLNVLDLALYKYGISLNKLFDYMAAERPIIMASNAANNPVRDAGGGITVPADDADAIAVAMSRVASASNAQQLSWGTAARRHVQEHFDYERLAKKLDGVLDEAITRYSSSTPSVGSQ